MKRTMTAVEARQKLGEVLEGVFYRGDEVVIERAGKPMAVVVPARLYEGILRRRERVMDAIDRAQMKNKDTSAEDADMAAIAAVREYRSEKAPKAKKTPARAS